MIYIKTISSSRVDNYTGSLGAKKIQLHKAYKGLYRILTLFEIYQIFRINTGTTIYVSEERLEFRLMTYLFTRCEIVVVHPGLLFSQRLRLSNNLYRLFYPTFMCLPFSAVNGLNKFKTHIVFYEDNIEVLRGNNQFAQVLLAKRDKIVKANEKEKKSVLLIPSAWSYHGLFPQEKEQLMSFLEVVHYFKDRGFKIYYKPHPRGDEKTNSAIRSHLGENICFIDDINEFLGSIVIGNISTLLVDLKDSGFRVFKYLTVTMQSYSNSSIDKIENFDRFEN